MVKTISDLIIAALEKHNIRHIFGIPGYQNLKIFDSIIDSNIKSVLVTNETTAPFMASGYNLASGKIAACISIPGPGFTNMFTGLADALVSSTPLLVLVVKGKPKGKRYCIHEIDQLAAVRPIVKDTFVIDSPEEVLSVIENAFFCMCEGEPGPVVIEIQENILNKACDETGSFNKEVAKESFLDDSRVLDIIKTLNESNRCCIYFGKGAFDSSEELTQLAEIISAPIASTISGKGIVPEDHPLSVGLGFGPSGSKCAEEIFLECDLLLAIGCKFSEMATGMWGFKMPDKLIHIDKSYDVLNKNYEPALSICGDAKSVLREILKHKQKIKVRDVSALIKDIKERKDKVVSAMNKPSLEEHVDSESFFYTLRSEMKRDAILTVDCGFYQLWSINDFEAYVPGSFITSSDYQTMGSGIPAAIGAKLANREKDVVCVCGDGAFLMSGFELVTSKKEGLDLKCIVFNDGELGLIKNIQKNTYSRTTSVGLLNPDFEAFAKSIGVNYFKINTNNESAVILKNAFLAEGTSIIEVTVRYENEPRYLKGLKKTIWGSLSSDEKLEISKKMKERLNDGPR